MKFDSDDNHQPVRMGCKRCWLAVSFILNVVFDRTKVAKKLFTGRDELDGVVRVGGGVEVGDVHDVALAHAEHHQVSADWLLEIQLSQVASR